MSLPDPGSSIPNTASVKATEPDPDCTDETPEALCNDDDEDTPRPAEKPAPTTTAAPSARTVPAGPSGPLPRTGSAVLGLVVAGTVTVLLGVAVLASRRRAAR